MIEELARKFDQMRREIAQLQLYERPFGGLIQVYNAADYGASPSATAAVNTTAIQATITAAEAAKGIAFVSAGTYNTNAELLKSSTGVLLLGAGKNATILNATHIVGNVIRMQGGAAILGGGIKGIGITCSTPGVLVGINNVNGQHCEIDDVQIGSCLIGIKQAYDSNVVSNSVVWYCTTGIQHTSGANAIQYRAVKVSNCTTGYDINGGANTTIYGGVVQTNTKGIYIRGGAYATDIRTYLEDNDLDIDIAGVIGTRIEQVYIAGFLNHSGAAGPAIALTYCRGVDISDLAILNVVGEPLSIGDQVQFLHAGNVLNDSYPYIAPNFVHTIAGPISRINLLHNGHFGRWTGSTTTAPDGWTLSSCTVLQETADIRDGVNAAKLTATGASSVMYVDIPVPVAYRKAGMTATLVADIKYVSGTSAKIVIEPEDDASATQGISQVRTTTSASWTTIATQPCIFNANTTKMRVGLCPDSANTSGVALFARIGVYFGSTPWAYERNPIPLEGTATWNPGVIPSGGWASTTVTVTGARVGDVAKASFSSITNPGLDLTAHVTAANTVTVTLHNPKGEKIANGSFEVAGGGGADIHAYWIEHAVGAGGAMADTTTAAEVHGGGHAIKITTGATGNSYDEYYMVVVPGKTYYYEIWTRGDGVTAGRIQIWDNTNSADILAITSTGVSGTSYSVVKGSFVAPANCVSAVLYLLAGATNADVAYFDDVSVYEAEVDLASGLVTAYVWQP